MRRPSERALTVALLLLCLLNPATSRPKPGANFLAVVVDNSRGLNVSDRNASGTRADLSDVLPVRT